MALADGELALSKTNKEFPVMTINALDLPCIGAHIRYAQSRNRPSLLTYSGPNKSKNNRQEACSSFRNNHLSKINRRRGVTDARKKEFRDIALTCDEYPFASTVQGGVGASVWGVPKREQDKQDDVIRNFYNANKMTGGEEFRVEVINYKECTDSFYISEPFKIRW
ncbi:hypothetical protein DSM106972_038980 [Dulcicalothrix desertica PCC 7102]|uniref:Deoxyribonuclease NucA/NucB domain-containing protein n=1 Tax=Dulcicalothrix desertica PCC 7102 TaxID=232991 RepID=A0A3S1CLC0_9CYAN|nr:NucA/NucB deoxyribonuclease domain-containing protein [Dulcicalothrix desertica]RUT05077.1 hypothetical protein DSM106972_038980 [Dulcicalothrix desertica PCC 7102]